MAVMCRAAAKRCETKPSMLRRCNGWDYRQPCIYQITIVLADRRSNALGRLVIDNDGGLGLPPQAHDKGEAASGAAATRVIAGDVAVGGAAGAACSVPAAAAVGDPTAVMAHVELTAAGEAVVGEWRRISEHHPEVKPLAIQVMPDHVHFILQVLRPMAKPLGNVIGGFKGGSSKAAVGRPGLWAEGFQDTILFHEGQLKAMFNYLRDNPRRLAVKRLAPWLFQVRRDVKIHLGLPPQARDTGDVAGPAVANAPRLVGLASSVPAAVAGGFVGHFSAIGNEFLLGAASILQVQCSRSDFAYKRVAKSSGGMKIARGEKGEPIAEMSTPRFEAKRDELLAAARHGAVVISPCISDGEREIARLVFKSGGSVITLRNMGFSPLYKPGGKLFDQTANGKLLMLAPGNWPYQTAEKPMTRLDACTLNRIAQLIAGKGAVEINYKGMRPENVDKLVIDSCSKL